ncbi:MAG: hypothetical protein IPN67_19015 [Bacteroidales bacterium]|nr:hypothetical protein [Bacteroidales bacterium]
MCIWKIIVYCLISSELIPINAQDPDTLRVNEAALPHKEFEINGFVRGGIYAGIDKGNNIPYVSSAFSDLGLKLDISDGLHYKAIGDLRFRYGSEFREPVNGFGIREGYIKVYGKKWDWSAGQQIIKWGRTDFTNSASMLNPVNYISRSPDREDMDLGNLLSSVNWYPSDMFGLVAVIVPLYRPSVLLIEPVPLPAYVTLNQITSLFTDKKMLSYGLKAEFHISGADWSLLWFDGYDPMPGIRLSEFTLDMSGLMPVHFMELTTTPYKIRMAGLDFEFAAGEASIRGEASWSAPYLSLSTSEYVPFPEINWVTGIDWSTGIWRFTAEYSGKGIIGFIPSVVDPVFGTEPDYEKLAELFQIPGFDLPEYVRLQVAAFNRLYNYQLRRFYHSAGLKIDADPLYGRILPSVFTMYNFTSGDLLIIPEIKIKPADGLAITAGAEFYSGKKGSLFDIVDGFMNSVYLSVRVDF